MDQPWPDGCPGAVSLTFDDGLASQLNLAVGILEQHDMRATFYLNPWGEDWEERLAPWAPVACRGHELGNHTAMHPCSQAYGDVPPERALEHLGVDDVARDIDVAEARLIQLSHETVRSFAYPCFQDFIGMGSGRQSYVPVVAERFPAARTQGQQANHPRRCDLHQLWSYPAERLSAATLVGYCELAADAGSWCIFTFHGIHEGHLAIADVDLDQLCCHLQRHRDRIWTAPVVDVARSIRDWRASDAKTPL